MSPEPTPPEGLCGRWSDEQGAEVKREGGPATGPQTGAGGFEGAEVHYWDAEKTAEVARLLAEHPPRDCFLTTTTIGQPLN